MTLKENIELLLSGILDKCTTDTEKQLYKCIYVDLMKVLDDNIELTKRYNASRYTRTLPLINALKKDLEFYKKENENLKEERSRYINERDKYRNRYRLLKDIMSGEEIGIDLETLYKALTKGIWVRDDKVGKKHIPREKISVCLDEIQANNYLLLVDGETTAYCLYKQTWALRKEDLK